MNWLSRVFRREYRVEVIEAGDSFCPFCGTKIERNIKQPKCPGCKSPPRVRSLVPLLRDAIMPRFQASEVRDKPLLVFSAAGTEQKVLASNFSDIASVSLFGHYGSNHRSGVDARSLDGFGDNAYAGHYSCLLFDYFDEHERAIAEAYRVIAPGGVFFTHILHTRVVEGNAPPRTLSVIEPGPGYYQYIPEGEQMMNVRVGAAWFLKAMEAAGFGSCRWRVRDPSGVTCDWWVGWK